MTNTPIVDPGQLAHHVASMYRDVANETGHDLHFHAGRVLATGGRLALADIVTERPIPTRTAAQPDLWAACIAGASQRDDYRHDITATGLELLAVKPTQETST